MQRLKCFTEPRRRQVNSWRCLCCPRCGVAVASASTSAQDACATLVLLVVAQVVALLLFPMATYTDAFAAGAAAAAGELQPR
jgi:hypothetical protein